MISPFKPIFCLQLFFNGDRTVESPYKGYTQIPTFSDISFKGSDNVTTLSMKQKLSYKLTKISRRPPLTLHSSENFSQLYFVARAFGD